MAALAVLALGGLLGCDADDPASPQDIGEATDDAWLEPTDATDGGAPDAQDLTGPKLIVGTHVAGLGSPEVFKELHPGDELEIELGTQGSWMVVIAFKTRDLFESKIQIECALTTGGDALSALAIGGQELVPGGDGWHYFYDLFVIIDDDLVPGLAGSSATITSTVRDTLDHVWQSDLEVVLAGGATDTGDGP